MTQLCPKLDTSSAPAALSALQVLAKSSPHWRARLARLGRLRACGRAIKVSGHPHAVEAVWRAIDGYAGVTLAREPALARVSVTVQDVLGALTPSPVHVAVHEPGGRVISEYLLSSEGSQVRARCADRRERVITPEQFRTLFTLTLCTLSMRAGSPASSLGRAA